MTSVEKLLVQGIRSFDPKEPSVIDFYKPLTLIVGANGAGKTTIIECLKYAATGEMPPNCANGQAFIHDPKIAGEAEVKAQIKLRFKNPNGKPIVATRSLCLIQKANNKQEYRQVDSSLQSFNADGQKVSKSFRCSDLDKEIPELMGVAKPVLKNVIFCHQEDSNWPLSESAKLKVKFDEIFAAVRYTKALKSIKDKRKELNAQIKEFKLKLEVVNTNREHANRIKKDIDGLEGKLKVLRDGLKQMGAQMKDKKIVYDRTSDQMRQVESALADVAVLEARKVEMERTKNQLFNSLSEVFEESDEELVFMSKSFNDELDVMVQAERELAGNMQRLAAEKDAIVRRKNNNANDIGRLETIATQQQEISANVEKQTGELVTRYKLDRTMSTADLLTVLGKKYGDIGTLIATTEANFKERIAAAQDEAQRGAIERQSLVERKSQHEKQIATNVKKLAALAEERDAVLSLSKRLVEFHKTIEKTEAELEALELEFQSANYDATIERDKAARRDNEAALGELRALAKAVGAYEAANAKLVVKRGDVEKKERMVDAKMNEHADQIANLLGASVTAQTLGQTIKTETKRINNQRQEKQEELADINNQINRTENEIKFIKEELDKKMAQVKKIAPSIATIDTDNIGEKIAQLDHSIHTLTKSLAILESEDVLYKEYIEHAHDSSECSLCSREMDGLNLDAFVTKLKGHSDDIPVKIEKLRGELASNRVQYDRLVAAKPNFDLHVQLTREDIPKRTDRIKEINDSLEANLRPLKATIVKDLAAIDSKIKTLRSLEMVAASIDSLGEEIAALKKDIAATDNGQEKPSRSLADVNRDLDELQAQQEFLVNEIDRLSSETKANRDKVHAKRQIIHSCKEKLSAEKGSTEIVERIRQTTNELNETNASLTTNISTIKESIESLDVEIVKAKEQLAKLRSDLETKSNNLQKEKTVFGNKLTALKSSHTQLIDMTDLNANLERLRSESEAMDMEMDSIEEDRTKGAEHIDAIKNNLAQRDITKRVITDNLQFRQQRLNVETLAGTIAKKKATINSVVSPADAEANTNLLAEITALKSKIDQATGQQAAIESHIATNSAELSKAVYRGVDEAHKDLLISVETAELVYKDLDRYHKALDKALMKYHVLKMEEINKSIRELWQATYRGGDIDTIEIRSEESTAANKSINYRVVMIKGDVELDMRGRCSAGQKVLACLVIRLALAENFCTNCGILALDEPTSHLDRANIESFAMALLNITEARKAQRGFQLIIITHDVEFVQYLSRGNFTDYYWRVTKDANLVERMEISKM
eukprot:gene12198-14275_t